MDPERLAALPLFADLDEADRGEVAACTHEVSVAAGETVATQGDNAYEFSSSRAVRQTCGAATR